MGESLCTAGICLFLSLLRKIPANVRYFGVRIISPRYPYSQLVITHESGISLGMGRDPSYVNQLAFPALGGVIIGYAK